MSDIVLSYILLFIALELFEVEWQKATTLIGMLAKMYHYYQKSIFLFLLLHPTFIFSIVFATLMNYNLYSVILVSIKFLDIATKLLMMQQIFVKKDISKEVSVMLLSPLHWSMPYAGLSVYPFLIYYALVA